MAKLKLTGQEQVTQHIGNLDTSIKETVQYLREIILATDPQISEHIKWNNPAFYFNGEMAPYDPKEYKRDIIVFNLFKNRIMLVFPSGAKVNDATGFLTGDYADGRRVVVFNDLEDAKARSTNLQAVIVKWLSLVEK